MNRQLCSSLCLFVLLTACAPKFQDAKVANIPVNIVRPGMQNIDLDIALDVARQSIRETLPAANFRGMVFSGKCQNLPRLEGKLVLIFEQVRPGLFKQQVIRGDALIDTAKQTMSLDFADETEFYPLVRKETFAGDSSFRGIAMLAHKYITELDLPDCDVTITQIGSTWDVRCGALENFIQKCRFEISNGAIHEKPK